MSSYIVIAVDKDKYYLWYHFISTFVFSKLWIYLRSLYVLQNWFISKSDCLLQLFLLPVPSDCNSFQNNIKPSHYIFYKHLCNSYLLPISSDRNAFQNYVKPSRCIFHKHLCYSYFLVAKTLILHHFFKSNFLIDQLYTQIDLDRKGLTFFPLHTSLTQLEL